MSHQNVVYDLVISWPSPTCDETKPSKRKRHNALVARFTGGKGIGAGEVVPVELVPHVSRLGSRRERGKLPVIAQMCKLLAHLCWLLGRSVLKIRTFPQKA
jgi:hypothetical protein